MVLVEDNKPKEISLILSTSNFLSNIILKRKVANEYLMIMKVWRNQEVFGENYIDL
jgi:hypothetical protein